MLDFNTADPQRSFDVIPAGTVAELAITVRPGRAGEGGWLRRSKAGDSEGLDLELTVVTGEYAKRKCWVLLTIAGTTEGHAQAAGISESRIRAILESAHGVRPDDDSEAARQARRISSYGDLDGLRFIGKIGVAPAKGDYPAKNILLEAITPDRTDWHRVEQVKPATAATPAKKPAAASAAPVKIEKPRWAK